jgi:hypothetical protein
MFGNTQIRLFLFAAQCFNTESMQKGYHSYIWDLIRYTKCKLQVATLSKVPITYITIHYMHPDICTLLLSSPHWRTQRGVQTPHPNYSEILTKPSRIPISVENTS